MAENTEAERERTANQSNATVQKPMDEAGHTVSPEDPLYDFEVENDSQHRKEHAGGGTFRGNAAVGVNNGNPNDATVANRSHGMRPKTPHGGSEDHR